MARMGDSLDAASMLTSDNLSIGSALSDNAISNYEDLL
jgi:hypothetical protein